MKKLATLAAALVFAALAGVLYNRYQQRETVRAALDYGQLAPLPATTTSLRTDTKGGLFSRTFWLTFQASKGEIGRWLKHSPRLAEIPLAQATLANYPVPDAPAWFDPAVIHQTNRQVFRLLAEGAVYGVVWVDWQTQTVYVEVSRS